VSLEDALGLVAENAEPTVLGVTQCRQQRCPPPIVEILRLVTTIASNR